MSRATGRVHRHNGAGKPERFGAARILPCALLHHSLPNCCCGSSPDKASNQLFPFQKEKTPFLILTILPAHPKPRAPLFPSTSSKEDSMSDVRAGKAGSECPPPEGKGTVTRVWYPSRGGREVSCPTQSLGRGETRSAQTPPAQTWSTEQSALLRGCGGQVCVARASRGREPRESHPRVTDDTWWPLLRGCGAPRGRGGEEVPAAPHTPRTAFPPKHRSFREVQASRRRCD